MSDDATPADPVPSWEAQFRAMERDWSEIAVGRTRALAAGWRRAMSAMRREHDRLVADGRWLTGPTDFLDVIGLARDENTHSRMLRWLLDPTGRHRLGRALARRLVEHCTGRPAPATLAVRAVRFSEWRNDREADLVGPEWPREDADPDVRLQWRRGRVRFADGDLICGVRTSVERYRQVFAPEARPGYPRQEESWWPAYGNVAPPAGRFWEGDNLKEYRDRVVETLLDAWRDLAPLVDRAIRQPRS